MKDSAEPDEFPVHKNGVTNEAYMLSENNIGNVNGVDPLDEVILTPTENVNGTQYVYQSLHVSLYRVFPYMPRHKFFMVSDENLCF